MKFDQMTNDGQAKSQPSVHPRRGAIALTESFEHVGQKRGFNTWSTVFNLNENVRGSLANDDFYFASIRSKFRRVRKNIPDHLLETIGIARDHSQTGINQSFNLNFLR